MLAIYTPRDANHWIQNVDTLICRFRLILMLSLVLIFCTPGAHFSKSPVTFRVRRDVIRTLFCTLLNIPIMRFLWFVIEQTQLIVNRS